MRWLVVALAACGIGSSTIHTARLHVDDDEPCIVACRRATGVEPRTCDRDGDTVSCELARHERVPTTSGDCATACGRVHYLVSCGMLRAGVDCVWRIPNE